MLMRLGLMRMYRRRGYHVPLFLLLLSLPSWSMSPPVTEVMDDLVARLMEEYDAEALSSLEAPAVFEALSPEQRNVLASEYWVFEVNVPVVVSVMRDTDQATVPFWLDESGFERTQLVVRNENYSYEVWQQSFPAGRIGLGINGFDRHRPHYFVGVGAQEEHATPELTSVIPETQEIYPFAAGSSIYHDWPGLVLTEVPDMFDGHLLLPTIRGRAREAHLIGAFRETSHPSAATPDMITLTWSDDPTTTQTIQWRTHPSVEEKRYVYYRAAPSPSAAGWMSAEASFVVLEDRNIINDRSVRWHTATLRALEPDTEYEYVIGTPDGPGGEGGVFFTAPAEDRPFTFLWMSDTHSNTASIPLLQTAWERHPDTAFLTISGDLVGTGQHRDDWDALLANYDDFLRHHPLMPSIGNHDAIDGMGSELYRTLLTLPDNGPEGFAPGQSFHMRYANLLLVSLDVTAPITEQNDWLEATLRDTDALWKVAVLHFPPYSPSHDYDEIRREWGALFDRYHVDLVLAGHVHYYLRTWPLHAGERVESPNDGTIYIISVAVPGRTRPRIQLPYAEVVDFSGIPTCSAFSVEGDRLTYRAYAADGSVRDEFTVEKQGE